MRLSLRLKYRVDETKVSIAFGLDREAPSQQDVYAFLPVRRYGLNFVVQVGGGSLVMLRYILHREKTWGFDPLMGVGCFGTACWGAYIIEPKEQPG